MEPLAPPPKPGLFESVSTAFETASGRAIIAVNLIPAAGLLFLKWDVFSVVFLYWFENVVLGVYQALRMIMATGAPSLPVRTVTISSGRVLQEEFQRKMGQVAPMMKFFLIPFFCVHYGIFTAAHGAFVMGFFGNGGLQRTHGIAFRMPSDVGPAMMALVIIYSFIFVKDYVIGQQGKTESAPQLMMEPYGRIVALHLFIMVSGIFVTRFRIAPQILLAVVLAKTAWDCRTDSRRRAPPSATTALPAA